MADSQNYSDPKNDDAQTREEKARHDEILDIARQRYQLAETEWSEVYNAGLDDLKNVSGDQWEANILSARKLENRPSFTVNRLPQFIRQIANDQRQNRPSIKISPVDDNADKETAKIIQGLIKHIENRSNADSAYDRAFECALTNSFGFFRIRADYASPTSFKQELIIDRIADPFTVRVDPYFKKPDGADMNWGFIECEYSKDDYTRENPDSKVNKDSWQDFKSSSQGWVRENAIRVCEYYCKEFKDVILIQLSDGNTYDAKELNESNWPKDEMGQNLAVSGSRKSKVPVIKHYKINGCEVLEETEFPGIYIPIIPVFGNEHIVNGKRILESLIRHAKDSQKLHNFWISAEAEAIALTPKAPYIAAIGQIPKEVEHQWKTANSKTHAYLLYEPKAANGQLLPPPQRTFAEPAVQAITNARLQSAEDLKATTGIYDSALGARSNETSGVAIRGRQAQAQTSNYHFIDNLNRSIRHGGKIIVGAIPTYYDHATTERILGEEGNEEVVKLNQPTVRGGEQVLYDVTVGEYDVHVDTGPNFATKREESREMLMEFLRVIPNKADLIADLVARNSDFAGSTELAERLLKTLPPGIADNKDQKPIPPEVQAQMQQMDQMVQQLTAKLNEANETIKMKQVEIESKERIEFAKLEQEATIKLADLESKESLQILAHQIAELNGRMKLLHINQPIEQNLNGNNFNGPDSDQFLPEAQQQPLMEGQ